MGNVQNFNAGFSQSIELWAENPDSHCPAARQKKGSSLSDYFPLPIL